MSAIPFTLMPRPKANVLTTHDLPEARSFYHLNDGIEGKACCGTACFVARHLNPSCWEKATTQKARVYCLGKCYIGPACVNDDASPFIKAACRTPVILERMLADANNDLASYTRAGGYRGLRKALDSLPASILETIAMSEMRGRGGAGYPEGHKWILVAQHSSPEKYIVANADEGDPGAYVDRFIMERDPHALIEGMAIAARAVGATKGWIYVRREYPSASAILKRAIAEAHDAGLLEFDGSCFDIEICEGRGSYLCGEETALFNSIEGKRPFAMARPPFAVDRGLFGCPTVINNVETLAATPWIMRNGAQAYRSLGFSKSRGTKVVSLNSLFQKPGLYEVEFGLPVRDIVESIGGGLKTGSLKGLMIGGPLAGIVPPALLDTRFGFEELHSIGCSVGHGGIVAFDQNTTIGELVHYIFSFGAYESCGKCTPCRIGTRRLELAFQNVAFDSGRVALHWDEWRALIDALKLTSLCGHGIGLADFAESVERHYGAELRLCFE